MAIKSLNFDYDAGNPTANLYTAADWREMQMAIVSNGIVLNAGVNIATDTSLNVTAITGGVNIANGKIAIQGGGGIITNEVAENVLIGTDGTYKIILEFNSVLGKIYSTFIPNTTALTRTATVWQMQLATVFKSGATYIITDTRADDSVCGYANRLATSYQSALQAQLNTGWIPSAVVITYASADGPTFVVNTASSLTSVIGVGNRIKLTQTTAKAFIVTAITATTITLYGGTNFSLVNTTISNVYYSNVKAPLGFPLDPAKWTTIVQLDTTVTKSSPTAQTYYQFTGYNLPLGIGCWDVSYKVPVKSTCASASVTNFASAYATLSTNGTSETDSELTSVMWDNNSTNKVETLQGSKQITLAAKQTLYLLAKVDDATATSVALIGVAAKAYIKAVCAYL